MLRSARPSSVQSIWHILVRSVDRLSDARPGYAAAAFALYVISLAIAGARWRGFLRALGGDVGVTRATLATVGGIAAGNLAPVPGGEAGGIAVARMGGRATWQQATAAAVWDRLSEVPPIVVLTVVAVPAIGSLAARGRPTPVAIGVFLAAAAVVLFAAWRLRRSGVALTVWRERLAQHRVSA